MSPYTEVGNTRTMQTQMKNLAEKTLENAENLPGLALTGFSKALETLLNQLVRLDEDQGIAFQSLDEKVIQLTLTDLGITLFVIYQIPQEQTGVFSVQTHLMGRADAHIKTTLSGLILKQTAQEISGEMELGKTFINALKDLEIDWEEHLSHYTGDLIAFKVGHGVRSAKASSQKAKQKIGDTFKEYLQFEINAVPTASQVKRFKQDVSVIADEVDSLAARIDALTS